MTFQLDETSTLEELVLESIEKLKKGGQNFTAYDVSKEVHELIRYNNIRLLIHDYLADDNEVERISSNHTIDGQVIPAISYGTKSAPIVSTNAHPDRLVIKIDGIIDAEKVFLMELNDGRLALTNRYFQFRNDYNGQVIASYETDNSKVFVRKSRIVDHFPNGYNVYSEGTTIFFEEA